MPPYQETPLGARKPYSMRLAGLAEGDTLEISAVEVAEGVEVGEMIAGTAGGIEILISEIGETTLTVMNAAENVIAVIGGIVIETASEDGDHHPVDDRPPAGIFGIRET